MKKVVVFITDGSEEMEVVIVTDLLRRANIQVDVVGVGVEEHAECSRKIKIIPDKKFSDFKDYKDYDAIFIPGGAKGADTLSKDAKVLDAIQYFYNTDKLVTAVCAGPLAILKADVAVGKKITSHPTVKEKLIAKYEYKDVAVVKDGNLITGNGPGACFELGLSIIEYLVGGDMVNDVKPGLMI